MRVFIFIFERERGEKVVFFLRFGKYNELLDTLICLS